MSTVEVTGTVDLKNAPPPDRFRPNPDVDRIAAAMGALAIGESIAYETMNRLIGHDVRHDRYVVSAARRRLLHEGKVYQAVTGKGYVRLSDAECLVSGGKDIESCRRKAYRAGKKVQAARIEVLTPEERIRHSVVATQALFLAQGARPAAARRLNAAVAAKGLALTFDDTLSLFKASVAE